MVSWSKLFNKFLFLKSAPPLSATDPFFHFHSMILSRFQSPFSFTIHLHSLIRVTRRDKKKHFKVQSTRDVRLAGTRCPPTVRLVVHFANTPLSAILTGTSERHIAVKRLKRDTVLYGQPASIRVLFAPNRRENWKRETSQLTRSTSPRPLLFLLNFLLIKISVLFHSVFTVLFSFPSQYLFTIGLWFNI